VDVAFVMLKHLPVAGTAVVYSGERGRLGHCTGLDGCS